MRKLLLAGVAALAVAAAAPAMAQDNRDGAAAVGGTAGGVTGGTIGFFLGGPIGAIVGGFAGAVIGAEAAVSADSVAYTANNPVDPIYLDSDLEVGGRISGDITLYDIEGDPDYGYAYVNNRVWIVDKATGEIVQSPGYVIPERSVAYVRDRSDFEIDWDGEVAPGVRLEGSFEFGTIPDDRDYVYAYVDGRPVLVDRDSRVVVWVG